MMSRLLSLPLIFCLFQGGALLANELAETGTDEFDAAVLAVHEKDYRNALLLFRPLAEGDAADAQFNLALLVKAGLGQPRNYTDAYYWAVLSDLGREHRAKRMVEELGSLLPAETLTGVHERILNRLRKQLEEGRADAILKYARMQAEFMAEPDLEQAYVWYSIAQALGQRGGFEGSASVAEQLEMDALITAQNVALGVFEQSVFSETGEAPTN